MNTLDVIKEQKMVDNMPLEFFEQQKSSNGDVVLEYNFSKKSHIVVCTLKYGLYEGRGYGKNEHDAKRFAAVNVIRNLPSELFVSYLSYRNKMLNDLDISEKVLPEVGAMAAMAKEADEDDGERLVNATFTVGSSTGLATDSLASELSLGTLNHEAAHSLNTETTGVVLDLSPASEKAADDAAAVPVVWYQKLWKFVKFDCLRKNADD